MARCLRNNGKALRPYTFPPRGFVSFPESVVGPPRERFGLGMRFTTDVSEMSERKNALIAAAIERDRVGVVAGWSHTDDLDGRDFGHRKDW
jgi:hypothetical protein